jgi:TPP-dependent pyruvate/acetoin dehydrogenase alpha subunit
VEADLWALYRQMLRNRLFEEAVKQLWEQGKIAGEMHLGIGEEAIVAGVVDQLQEGDAMALDHRGTAPLLMRGVDPVLLLREFLGRPDGLCGGMGGHMHLFSPSHLAASSGIVGASGPAAAGFALAASYLRPEAVAVAFFGEGATNQGMLLEAMNLAAIWQLPVLFVCKDNAWAITTPAASVIAGTLAERARGFGICAYEVDGSDVEAVWNAANDALERARAGGGPAFIHGHCTHFEGHFLGDALLRAARNPLKEMLPMVEPLLRATFSRRGAPMRQRFDNLRTITGLIQSAKLASSLHQRDPITHTRHKLESDALRLEELTAQVTQEIQAAVESALALS